VNAAFSRIEELFVEEEFETALAEIYKLAPIDVDDDVRHLEAQCHAALGNIADAEALYARLTQTYPLEPLLKLEWADLLIRQPGDSDERAREGLELVFRVRSELAAQDDLCRETILLEGLASLQLGEFEVARAKFSQVAHDIPEAVFELALLDFEAGHFEGAQKGLETLVRENDEDGWCQHYLGLLAERRGQANAQMYFERAQALEPEIFRAPLVLPDHEFQVAVEHAVEQFALSTSISGLLARSEAFPSDAAVRDGLSPFSFAVLENAVEVVFFRQNLLRSAASLAELHRELQRALEALGDTTNSSRPPSE
jgi:tetratricopeptide (TPR) repeat protein